MHIRLDTIAVIKRETLSTGLIGQCQEPRLDNPKREPITVHTSSLHLTLSKDTL